MTTQSNGVQQRTRTKTAPSFPRERQLSQQQQQPQQGYYIPSQQYPPPLNGTTNGVNGIHNLNGDPIDSWRLAPPRRSSRGPRTASPVDPSTRVFTWDHPPSSHPQQRFRRKSITSNTSSSDHHTLHRSSRSPSPNRRNQRGPTSRKMTGQSTASGPNGAQTQGCEFETALVNSRRRIPYSVGSDALAVVPPGSYHSKLDEKDERCLSVDILDLYHQLLPTEDTEERRRLFIGKLSRVLGREFPNSFPEVHVFGSSENRLGTNSSDVDVCVVTKTKEMDDTCGLASVLHEMVCVAAAKVPVVKIWDSELNIQCDINVNNSLAIENTRLVKLYVDIDERVRPLAMIIKYWAKSRLLNDAAGGGTLTSYTWILMVINFLQTRDPPILPSLHKIPHRQRMSNGIDVGFYDDIAKLKDFGKKNEETLGGLFYAFFVKFAFEFDYSREVISVRTGGSLSKEAKGWHLMQNNSLCVEEPFNTNRNLGNTADEATVKGLQLEFRRAVHYLADHTSLELACWPYQFPTAENPRPERHLPNIPPQYRQTTNNNYKKSKYVRPQGSSPPFKSPRARAQDMSHHRNLNSFSAGRQQYPFNPLNLNPPLPPQVPVPSTVPTTPQSAMSPNPGDIHHAYPPTPVDQLHYIDPFKNRQIAYYIPAFAPNGLPVYVPYTEDHVVYASPPQTPAMSDTSLSHQPQYPRSSASMQPFIFPQQYSSSSRGESVQRGRSPHRDPDHEQEEMSSSPTVPFQQPLEDVQPNPPSISPPYIPPPTKRRNSLPPNNRPNVDHRSPAKSSTDSSYISSSVSTTSLSQNLAASTSSVGSSDVFDEDFYDHHPPHHEYTVPEEPEDNDTVQETSVTPRPTPEKTTVKPTPKESPLPAGKSYAAALLNTTTSANGKPLAPSQPPRKESIVATNNAPKPIVTTAVDPPPRSISPAEQVQRRGSIWSTPLHPSSNKDDGEISPTTIASGRRASIMSISSNSPKKSQNSTTGGARLNVPQQKPEASSPSPSPAKKNRKRKGTKKKESQSIVTGRRQSIISTA